MNKKLQRQLQLAGLLKESKEQTLPFDLVREGNDGKTYVISRENSKYYIKTANTKENLQENDFDYLGGLANKGKHTSKSFESATFKLNLIFESERGSEESISLLSEKKFVLKQPKPKKKKVDVDIEKDIDIDFSDEDKGGDEDFSFGDEDKGGDEDFSFGDEESGSEEGGDDEFSFDDEGESSEVEGEFSFGDEESDEFSGEEGGVTGDTVKDIQSLTGKLGQKVRDTEDLSSDMQKWIAKSVISALDMDSLEDGDKQDIINSIGGDELDESEEGDYRNHDEDLDTPRGGEKYDRDELLFDADGFNGDGVVGEIEEDDTVLRASDLKRPKNSPRLQQEPNPTYESDRGYFRESLDHNSQPITEDHLGDKMTSHEQLDAYLSVEDIIRSHDLTLTWSHGDNSEIYLDLMDGGEKLAHIFIDNEGNIEFGEMVGDTFVGEPLDSLSDIDEILGDTENNYNEDMTENEETPVKTPTRTKPGTKPGEDSPFKPPMPTEDPNPKAKYPKGDAPAPAKPKTKPGTKPGEDSPFKPPMPTEDPKPKASDEDGVEFGY
jgi:hypothetical protein